MLIDHDNDWANRLCWPVVGIGALVLVSAAFGLLLLPSSQPAPKRTHRASTIESSAVATPKPRPRVVSVSQPTANETRSVLPPAPPPGMYEESVTRVPAVPQQSTYVPPSQTTLSKTTPMGTYGPRGPPAVNGVAENGSSYGETSTATGKPKTVEVRGYYRKDGTYVRGHYRSK
jgi:hypothetical protein